MPFKDELKDIYWKAIKPACDSAGFRALRVDELEGVFNINRKIIEYIFKSDAIVADLTEWNPNVFYEVGYAHALGTPTILITKDADDIPFDLKHFPHIVYGNKIKALRDELTASVRWHILNPKPDARARTLDIEIYAGEKNLQSGTASYDYSIKS